MKVAVLGGTGMLGSMLVNYLSKYFEIVATARNTDCIMIKGAELRYLDVIKDSDAEIARAVSGCGWIINAIGAISQRTEDKISMYLTNAKFPMDLARLIHNTPIIQIATDCIYSGRKGNYAETDLAIPEDDYGKSKLRGEVKVPNMYHIRCSIVGPERHGQSLLMKYLHGEINKGYTNHYWNGVTTLHFAKVCRGIIENNVPIPHMQHLVPADSVSKYELLKLFAQEYRCRFEVQPVESEPINRTLATVNTITNRMLWQAAGYPDPPSIAQMIRELAEYLRR